MNIKDVHYVPFSINHLHECVEELVRFLRLSAEFGCSEKGKHLFDSFFDVLKKYMYEYQFLILAQSDPNEPDSFEKIRALRPDGPRKLVDKIPDDYPERLRGAFYGRMAGCTLGAGMEFQSVDAMKDWAEHFGDEYPLTDYWSQVKEPTAPHYIVGKRIQLTKGHIDSVPPDDDTI